ncbi:MAG: hypothetical protein H0V82_12215 [Candidatus Protochlamydia sp.]|nr:hypothetical protein [Candidatus Protochlamydia sp.]
MKLGTPLLQRLERCVNCVQENGQELKVIFDKWYYLGIMNIDTNEKTIIDYQHFNYKFFKKDINPEIKRVNYETLKKLKKLMRLKLNCFPINNYNKIKILFGFSKNNEQK